jgi:hypothetical protein
MCGKIGHFRIGFGVAPEQRIACLCLSCGVQTKSVLRLDYKNISHVFESEDWEVVDLDLNSTFPSQTIYVDLPVHKSIVGARTMTNGSGSPFIWLISHLAEPELYMAKSEVIQELRVRRYSFIRKLPDLFFGGNLGALNQALYSVFPDEPAGGFNKGNVVFAFYRALDLLYMPILPNDKDIPLRNEFCAFVSKAREQNEDAFHSMLLQADEEAGFDSLSRKAIETICRCFGKMDAFLPALAIEHLRLPTPGLEEFSIFRDDFDEIKQIYVELFEVHSKILPIIGMIANLLKRGNIDQWGDGKTRSFSRALALKAVQKEFILNEYPEAKRIFVLTSRQQRNDFAHHKVRYDFASGYLINEKGDKVHVLAFLGEFLNVARSSHHTLVILEELQKVMGKDYFD